MRRTVLWGGALAGTLDIVSAFTFYGARGVKPILVLQTIASGVLGPAAYRGGIATAALGAALHFFIALTAALVYYFASSRLRALNRRPILWGMLYGCAVYLCMNLVVLPLSEVARPRGAMSLASTVFGVLAVVLLVGVPIALVCCQGLPECNGKDGNRLAHPPAGAAPSPL